MTERLLRVQQVFKAYDNGSVVALDGVDLTLDAGQSLAAMGPSGCGKSTLLSLIGLLDRPSAGRIEIAGEDLAQVADPCRFRARSVGFVFQDHHLIPAMTLLENVEAPMLALGLPGTVRRQRATELLERMDLMSRGDFLPARVSGGERQRAAVARALANRPRLLLADEPTGNLDSGNGSRVVDLFMQLAREQGLGILMATHNPEMAARCDRVMRMRDGRIDADA